MVTAFRDGVIVSLLLTVSLLACFLLGHSHRTIKRRSWWAGLLFTTVIAATLLLIFDYDSPRQGLIRVDDSDVLYAEFGRS